MRSFHNASRWLFLGALIYAPWAYGCTTPRTIRGLNWLLAASLGLWLVAQATGYLRRGSRGRRPHAHDSPWQRGAMLVPCVLLLLLGWWMAVNAKWIYDSDFFLFVPRSALIGAGPGSVDYAISVASMVRATLLIGVTLFVAQLCRDPLWLIRIWWTVALAAGSIALLGLAQKATGASMIFWESADPRVETFFATYYAHGNAGAYLNLVMPLSATLALRGFLRKGYPFARAVALVIYLLVMVALVSNTSRAGQAIGMMLSLGLAVCLRDLLFSRARRMEKKILLMAMAVIGFAVIAIAGVSQLDQSLWRWQHLESKVTSDARWLATRAATRAVEDASWVGFGPGTFRVVFPYYTNGLGPHVGGVWRFLHQDYLQTLMEWGWIGSACWALLFFGGMWTAGATLRRRELAPLTGRQRLFLTGAVLALGGVGLHALVDFPLQIASLQLYVAMFVGVCWGMRRKDEGRIKN